ncbi:unnamed protein product [Bursaphelenchus xylophilus]|uniref:Sulfide:quinone oxidoreductase, mitochondrial n=1 Tax=Bursaphelenchus xylophilus TaxID=6326 RepID=A0A1I7SWB2_BURXY|nr:unnamed protein product [Bursaphelenchus xylophilus]CAG9099126.1 unnamed protein product [Bursaphelenchus xylophilus]
MYASRVFCKESYRLVVVGAGTGGTAIAAQFSNSLPKGQIAIIDSSPVHYYQPGFTLLGGGLAPPATLRKERQSTLAKNVKWIKDDVREFNAKDNSITLGNGTDVGYDYLVIATGLDTRYDLIEGCENALEDETSGVCSIYRFDLAQKTYLQLQKFTGGTAVFTFPNTPIKCPGAPQKICYMADEIFKKNQVRDKTKIIFNNTLGVIFEVKKYEEALLKVLKEKDIFFNSRKNLIKVDAQNKIATFQIVDEQRKPTEKFEEVKYDLLHVGPPCTPVKALRDAAASGNPLTDAVGWVKVNEKSLQSTEFKNVFAFGDCAGTTNKKTAAAVAHQLRTVNQNLQAVMKKGEIKEEYDGYASCPLVIDSKHVILSEFNHQGPIETLPINQAIPSYTNYWITRYFLPWLYWSLHLKGQWMGPRKIRKILRLGRD